MDVFLPSVTGSLLSGFLLAAGWYFSCAGTGDILLRKILKRERNSFFSALFTGCGVLALLSLFATPLGNGWKWLFLLPAPFGILVFFRIRFRKEDLLFLLPLLPVLLLAGNTLMPPAGWDALVYQLTVPFRWAADGNCCVYSDLPYSGFPLLPQFLYRDMTALSGVFSPQFFIFFIWTTLLFFFRTLLPGRKAFLPAFLLVTSPMMGYIGSGSYAEVFTTGFFLAGVLCAGNPLISGLLAGFAFAVKGTGLFAAGALFLIVCLRRKEDSLLKTSLKFASGFAAGALPFYLRPRFLTGNPFHPYFAGWFSGEESLREMSQFHHAIGGGSFGIRSCWEILLAPLLAAFPETSALYDGCWGPALLFMGIVSLLPFFRKKVPFLLLPGLFLYVTWLFLTPQARFLLPLVTVVLTGGTFVLFRLESRIRKVCILLLLLSGFVLGTGTHLFRNALMGYRHFSDDLSTLYSRTGEMVPAAEYLHRLPPQEKTLLVFEERTLYFPRNAVIATPFFQSRFFTPPDSVTPDGILSAMKKAGASRLYFRIPEDDPDLDQAHLVRCERFLASLRTLAAEGRLVPEEGFRGKGIFFRRR